MASTTRKLATLVIVTAGLALASEERVRASECFEYIYQASMYCENAQDDCRDACEVFCSWGGECFNCSWFSAPCSVYWDEDEQQYCAILQPCQKSCENICSR